MAEFWSQIAPVLNFAFLGGIAWLIRGRISDDRRIAVMENEIVHLKARQREAH